MKHRLSTHSTSLVQPEDLLAAPNKNRLFIELRLGPIDEAQDQHKHYKDAHIHGAVYAQIRDVFAAPATLLTGNLPLPSIEQLAAQLNIWQVDSQTELVLYGPSMALAARGWWVLKWAGLSNVKVLDGGLKAWTASGGPVAQGDFIPQLKQNLVLPVLTPGHMPEAQVEDILTLESETLLIDARDEASYLSGCIPGAINLPASEFWTPDSQLRTVQECRNLFNSIGIDNYKEIIVYCGGGVLSAFEIMLLDALGKSARLFVGSWSLWSRSAERMALSFTDKVEA